MVASAARSILNSSEFMDLSNWCFELLSHLEYTRYHWREVEEAVDLQKWVVFLNKRIEQSIAAKAELVEYDLNVLFSRFSPLFLLERYIICFDTPLFCAAMYYAH